MVTRREVVTGATAGALGALSSTAETSSPGTAEAQSAETAAAEALRAIQREVAEVRRVLDESLRQPGLNSGFIAALRKQFEPFLRSNQKYPDYCDIGINVFTDVYDWHVKHGQQIDITRADNRVAIRFMFTWLVLVPTQEIQFIGIPYDRG